MTKVFRKYNKWLLAIFGSLLLVTFLIQGTMRQFQPDPGKRVVATIGPGETKVHAKEYERAEFEYKALSDLIPVVLKAPVPQGVGAENGAHWYLLTKEAEDAGLVGEAGDGVDWIPDLARVEGQLEILSNPQYAQFAQQLLNNPQLMAGQYDRIQKNLEQGRAMVGGRSNLRPKEMDLALAKLRGVYRLTQAYGRAARMSDATFTHHARDILTQASFDAVVINADKLTSTVAEPTEEQIKAAFEKYKGVKPGTGEYGFGYLRPKRVKLEWLTLSKLAIAGAVQLDPIEVNKFWLQNRAEFKGEFAAEKTKVEEKLRENKVQQVLDEADRAYGNIIKAATRKLPTVAGVKKLPDDWAAQRPTMEAIAKDLVAAVEKATKVKMPLPSVQVRASEFVPIEDLKSLGSLAFMQFRIGDKQGSFSDLIANTHELNAAAAFGPQVGVPFQFPVTDYGTKDVAYFTVLDAKMDSPAESLDEVRADVVRDVKLLEGFDKLKANAPVYQALAVTDGLEGVAKLFAAPPPAGSPAGAEPTPLPIDKRVVISKYRGDFAYPVLDDQSLRDSVMATLQLLGPDTRPTPENLVLRTITHALPAKLSLAVIQITGQRPLAAEDMRMIGDREMAALQEKEIRDLGTDKAKNPFSYRSMTERLHYKPIKAPGAAPDETNPEDKNPA